MKRSTQRLQLGGLIVAALVAGIGCSSSDSDDTAATDPPPVTVDEQEADDLSEEVAELEERLEAATSELAESAAEVEALSTDLAAASAANTELETLAAAETARADEAEATLAEITEIFPVRIDASVTSFEMIGRYTTNFTEAFCEGLPTCGTPRPPVTAEITQGPVGLILTIPGAFSTGLLSVNGNLTAGTDSNEIVQCNGAPRRARVIVTMFADGVSIDSDNNRTLDQLGAGIFVMADPVDDCPAASVFLATNLTPIR
jgi:hypothetical protein